MILDKIENLNRYKNLFPDFINLINFIQKFDPNDFQKGRFEIDENFFGIGLEYTTKPASECLFESHQKYVDFHFLLNGNEMIEVSDVINAIETKPYDEENDYALLLCYR